MLNCQQAALLLWPPSPPNLGNTAAVTFYKLLLGIGQPHFVCRVSLFAFVALGSGLRIFHSLAAGVHVSSPPPPPPPPPQALSSSCCSVVCHEHHSRGSSSGSRRSHAPGHVYHHLRSSAQEEEAFRIGIVFLSLGGAGGGGYIQP